MAPARVKRSDSTTIEGASCKRGAGDMRSSHARGTASIWPSLWKPMAVFTLILWLILRWRNVMMPEERTLRVEYVVKSAATTRDQQQQQLGSADAAVHSFKINASESIHLKENTMPEDSSDDQQIAATTLDQSAAEGAVDQNDDDGTNGSTKLHAASLQDEDDAFSNNSSTLDHAADEVHKEDAGTTNSSKEIIDQEAPVPMEDGTAKSSKRLEAAATVEMEEDVDIANSNSKLPAAAGQLLQTDENTVKLRSAPIHEDKDGAIDTARSPAAEAAGAVDQMDNDIRSAIDTTKLPASVDGLIQDIRAAALRANGGNAVKPLSEAAKEEWHDRNPCASREKMPFMYSRRKFAKDADPNPAWELVFREYVILHRTCTSRIQNMGLYLEERNTSTGCKFMICNPTEGSGLGNKILLISSCFLYAVLTQRVLLVPSSTWLCDIMCEPFEGSTWRLPDPYVLGLDPVTDFFESMDSILAAGGDDASPAYSDNVSDTYAIDVSDRMKFQPVNRFYCPTEQSFLRNVTCVGLVGCQYVIPKLFTIPTFRPTLESLFPTRMVLTDLLRRLMLPVDSIWRAIEDVDTMQAEAQNRRVGVQIRYFGDTYSRMHGRIESHIKQCAFENGLLPQQLLPHVSNTSANSDSSQLHSKRNQSLDTSSSSSIVAAAAAAPTPPPPPPLRTQVFIACLYDSFEKSLTMHYFKNPPANGHNVTIMQLTRKFGQSFNVEEDAKALVEIILLSFSDDIIVTPMSTFGGIAQAYGALVPWFVRTFKWFSEKPEDEEAIITGVPCVRGQSIDFCQHLPQKRFECPHDLDFNGISVMGLTPYFKDCLVDDCPSGMQIITSPDHHHHRLQQFLS